MLFRSAPSFGRGAAGAYAGSAAASAANVNPVAGAGAGVFLSDKDNREALGQAWELIKKIGVTPLVLSGLTGALGGYGYGKLTSVRKMDLDALKQRDLILEYEDAANTLRKRLGKNQKPTDDIDVKL